MSGFLSLLSSPAAQTIAAGAGALNYRKDYREARQANLDRYNQILGLLQQGGLTSEDIQKAGFKSADDMLASLTKQLVSGSTTLGKNVIKAYGDRRSEILPQIAAANAKINAGYGKTAQDVVGELGGVQADVTGGYAALKQEYADRLAREQQYLEGAGAQEKKDILRFGEQEGAAAQQGLAERGMTGSTLVPSVALAIGDRTTARLGTLNERLQQQRLALDTQLSGEGLSAEERGVGASTQVGLARAQAMRDVSNDALTAQERLNAAKFLYDTSLSGDVASATERTGNTTLGYKANLGGTALTQEQQQRADALNLYLQNRANLTGFIERRQDPYPQMPNFQQLGYNAGPTPSTPSGFGAYGPGLVSAGGSIGGAAILANAMGGGGSVFAGKMVVMFCIDALAQLQTPTGFCPLAQVEIGEQVRGADGNYHRVTAKDCGWPHPERDDDYVRIRKGARSLVCTQDHVVEGVPAGEWEGAERCQPVLSGDIALEGGGAYLANGFVVTSIIEG